MITDPEGTVLALFAAFCRVGGCFMLMPGFSSARIPMQIRLFVSVANLVQRVRRKEYRVHAHRPEAIVAAAARRGLRPVGRERGAIWRVAAFDRGMTSA